MPTGAALTGTTAQQIYTGNNVAIQFNGVTVGLVQSITVDKSLGTTPAHQVGSNLPATVYPTAAVVTVTTSKLEPQAQENLETLAEQGIIPSSSLAEILTMSPFTMTIVDANGVVVCTVYGALLSTDSLNVPLNQALTRNLTFIASDATAR